MLRLLQMGKPPKKRSISDKVRKAKTTKEIKNNPFEVKVNRKKFDVLGRKSKHDVGLPGVSRSKAITKVREPGDDIHEKYSIVSCDWWMLGRTKVSDTGS